MLKVVMAENVGEHADVCQWVGEACGVDGKKGQSGDMVGYFAQNKRAKGDDGKSQHHR